MAYICEKPKGSCEKCYHYRASEDYPDRKVCYATVDRIPDNTHLLEKERALTLFDEYSDMLPIHLFYTDGAEELATERSEIENHNGLIGVEAQSWDNFQSLQNRMNKLTSDEPEKEKILFDNKKCVVGIYQLKYTADTKDLHFADMFRLKYKKRDVERNNYVLVYAFEVKCDELRNEQRFLENIFEKFNQNIPCDFEGHSLSVSDIVVIQQNGISSAYFVDTFGYKRLNNFI